MKKLFLIISILCTMLPSIVKAECSNEEKIELSRIVSNVKITPVFNEEREKFSIIISNITPSIYFRDMNAKVDYINKGSEVVLYDVSPNQSYRIKFFSAKPACYGEALTSSYVSLPGYNKYYKDPLCEGLEDYKICQKWVNYNYSRSKWEEEVKKIEKPEEKKPEVKPREKEVKGFYDYLGELYEKYYYIVLPIIIIACTIEIAKLYKKEKFF